MSNMAVTPLNFTEWAHAASRSFISEGTPMNESISKVASANELSPVQIQRVCELANHHAYAEIFKKAEDKTFEFPLAKVEDIMESLQAEPEKVAAEYVMDPVGTKKEIDSNSIFGVIEIGNELDVAESEKVASKALIAIDAAKEEIRGMICVNSDATYAAEEGFYKLAKQMVLNDTSLSDVYAACEGRWEDPRGDSLMAKVAMRMAEEGILGAKLQHMIKTSEAVDPALISEKLRKENAGIPTRIINGNHPIIAHVNTLNDKYKDGGNMEQSLSVLDDKAKMVRTRMQDLNSSKKVDQFVQSEAF